MQTILVTGAAGFIGSNLVLELLRSMSSVRIVGLDNMNDYYDAFIKEYRVFCQQNFLKKGGTPCLIIYQIIYPLFVSYNE